MRILIILLLLTGCSAKIDGYDPTTSALSQFFKVLGTGDTSEIKGKKSNDKEWEEVDE